MTCMTNTGHWRMCRACSWRGTLLDLMLEMAGKLMLARDPKATAAIDSAFVPAKATKSCCTQLTAMPVTQQRQLSEQAAEANLALRPHTDH